MKRGGRDRVQQSGSSPGGTSLVSGGRTAKGAGEREAELRLSSVRAILSEGDFDVRASTTQQLHVPPPPFARGNNLSAVYFAQHAITRQTQLMNPARARCPMHPHHAIVRRRNALNCSPYQPACISALSLSTI
ncbi:hypothetical protein MRB53_041302 [Persea americana]|nr:hypothetical protein MRB53_041302 [Persea americana]